MKRLNTMVESIGNQDPTCFVKGDPAGLNIGQEIHVKVTALRHSKIIGRYYAVGEIV